MKWFKDVLEELREANKTLKQITTYLMIIKVDTEYISHSSKQKHNKELIKSIEALNKEIKHIRKYTREAR